MIKNIVFDFDGTIADSMDAILSTVNNNADRYNFPKLSKRKINFLMGKGAKYLISYLKIPKYKIPFLMKEIRSKLDSDLKGIKPFKEMPEVLKKLQKNKFKLGILTSNSKGNVEEFIKVNKLDYFVFIYHGTSLFGKDKMIKKMLREQKLAEKETIYVGDEDRDIEAAIKAGVKSVAVTWGFNSKKLLKSSNPDFLIEKPSSLIGIVQKH